MNLPSNHLGASLSGIRAQSFSWGRNWSKSCNGASEGVYTHSWSTCGLENLGRSWCDSRKGSTSKSISRSRRNM